MKLPKPEACLSAFGRGNSVVRPHTIDRL